MLVPTVCFSENIILASVRRLTVHDKHMNMDLDIVKGSVGYHSGF